VTADPIPPTAVVRVSRANFDPARFPDVFGPDLQADDAAFRAISQRSAAATAFDDPAIGDALRLLHEDPARRWTVAALAAKVGMSRAAFAARFTSLVGQPPLTYLTGWRITLAADSLRDTEATVATVARKAGYEDAFAFSVAFKRARGVSPSAWRRQ